VLPPNRSNDAVFDTFALNRVVDDATVLDRVERQIEALRLRLIVPMLLPAGDRCGRRPAYYGEAAAIDFFGRKEGLPPALSEHNQFYFWGPRGHEGSVVLHINGNVARWREICDDVRVVGTIGVEYSAMRPRAPHRRRAGASGIRRSMTSDGALDGGGGCGHRQHVLANRLPDGAQMLGVSRIVRGNEQRAGPRVAAYADDPEGFAELHRQRVQQILAQRHFVRRDRASPRLMRPGPHEQLVGDEAKVHERTPEIAAQHSLLFLRALELLVGDRSVPQQQFLERHASRTSHKAPSKSEGQR
jgi:hypothetical protein